MASPDPQPVRAGIGEPHKSTFVIAANIFSLFLIRSLSLQVGRGELGRYHHSADLVASCFSSMAIFSKCMFTLPLVDSILQRGEDEQDVKNGMSSFTNFESF